VWIFGEPPAGLLDDVAATGATVVHHDLDPLASLIVAQRVAVAKSLALGLNPDQPRSLTRSVILG
jgi:fructoselysine-6-P-deglycase FrlB-like protein